MLGALKNFVQKVIVRLNAPSLHELEQQNRRLEQQKLMIQNLVDANFRTRAMLKRVQKLPINVLFVCHTPTLWSMFEKLYASMVEDRTFSVKVIALPYKHSSVPGGQYKDDGIFEYLEKIGVDVIRGYDKNINEWIDPASLNPDYIFFQTPYDLFQEKYSAFNVSMYAKICYIPYGMNLFSGFVDNIIHPISFFEHVKLFFLENKYSFNNYVNKFINEQWFNTKNIVIVGHTKIENFYDVNITDEVIWKHKPCKNIKRILWTPRWSTSDGTCHFFDYKDFFFEFCHKHQSVDFAFRPHPLCLQNFLKTGEMSYKDIENLRNDYENSKNMVIDESNEYKNTFVTSDILISDVSSMITEFFVTGKPIIYTHRIDVFNSIGKKISEGLYFVNNKYELERKLDMLLSGNDPLKEKRYELLKEVFYYPKDGSCLKIKNSLLNDFNC